MTCINKRCGDYIVLSSVFLVPAVATISDVYNYQLTTFAWLWFKGHEGMINVEALDATGEHRYNW